MAKHSNYSGKTEKFLGVTIHKTKKKNKKSKSGYFLGMRVKA